MKKDKIRQFLVVITVAVVIGVNYLANALPFNNISTKEISDSFKVFFVPEGYVFSIWGLIYLGLVAFAVFQALPSQRENPRLRKVGWLFILNGIANGLWLKEWHFQKFSNTLLLMLVILTTLIMIYLWLGIGKSDKVSKGEKWAVHVPFSLYLGWITVATIANITDVLYFYGWKGWGIAPQVWAVIMLTAAVVIAALMAFTRKDVAYLAVLIWAFIGIAVKFTGTQLVYVAAIVASALVAMLLILSLFLRRRVVS